MSGLVLGVPCRRPGSHADRRSGCSSAYRPGTSLLFDTSVRFLPCNIIQSHHLVLLILTHIMRVEINLPSQPGQQPSIVFDDQAQHLTSGIAASHDQHDCSSHSSDQLASMHITPPQSAAGAHASLYPVDPRLQIGGKPWAKPPAKPIAFVSEYDPSADVCTE